MLLHVSEGDLASGFGAPEENGRDRPNKRHRNYEAPTSSRALGPRKLRPTKKIRGSEGELHRGVHGGRFPEALAESPPFLNQKPPSLQALRKGKKGLVCERQRS